VSALEAFAIKDINNKTRELTIMCKSYLYFIKTAFLLSLLFFSNAQAELVLSAPPRESFKAGNKLYGPLAEHLTKLLGQKVTYKHPENWLHYQRELRNDVYDIVFDGPHFIS